MTSPLFSDDPAFASRQSMAETTVTNSNSSVTNGNDATNTPVWTTPQDEIHVAKCFRCDGVPLTFCRHCGQEFCSNHVSKYSNQYCYLCIAPDNLGLEYLPLEDEELDPETGQTVTHRGRRIKLIGEGWPYSMQMINSLDDAGLEIFIAERQRLLKEAVATAEYHRITLSHAEFTKEYKRHSKAAKLQRRYTELQQGTLRVGGKKHNLGSQTRKLSKDEEIMKQLGLTPLQFKALMKLAGKS